jgi:integrase
MSDSNSFPFREDRLKELSELGEYKDTSLSGFSLRISKTKKTFQVRRKRNGKDVRVKIGDYANMNLKKAKIEAKKALVKIESGINPNEERKEHENQEVTLVTVFNAYLDSKSLKDKTVVGYKQTINCYLSEWKEKPLTKLTEDEVTNIHQKVSKRSQAQADLMARVLRAIFNFAKYEYRGKDDAFIFAENPVKILSHKRQWNHVPRKQTRIRPTELKQYLTAVNNVRNNPEYDRFTRSVCDAVEFALFTGLRKQEVLNIEWERVNLKDSYFWIDETKNGDPLELPITDTLRKILMRCWSERYDSARHVFVSKTAGQAIKEPKYVLEKIRSASKQDDDSELIAHWHDLRRTYATLAESIGVGGYTLKRLLNHRIKRTNDVTAGYVVLSADELREPAKRVEQSILEHAGLIDKKQGVDATLQGLLQGVSEEQKRELIFQLSQVKENQNAN